MENIIITSTAKAIEIEYKDHSEEIGEIKTIVPKMCLSLILKSNYVALHIDGQDMLDLSISNSPGIYQVDFIDSHTPTSLEDLYNKLKVYLG